MRSLWLWQLLLYGVFATKVTPTYQLMFMRGLTGRRHCWCCCWYCTGFTSPFPFFRIDSFRLLANSKTFDENNLIARLRFVSFLFHAKEPDGSRHLSTCRSSRAHRFFAQRYAVHHNTALGSQRSNRHNLLTPPFRHLQSLPSKHHHIHYQVIRRFWTYFQAPISHSSH